MRKTGMKVVLLILGWSVLLTSFAPQAKAQNEGENATMVYIVPVKSVRADVMANWLKQPEPTMREDLRLGLSPYEKVMGVKDNTDKMHSAVPYGYRRPSKSLTDHVTGLELIIVNATKNELLVQGTPESARKVKEFVALLDQPVRSVDLKAQFVEVDAEEVAALKIAPDPFISQTVVLSNDIRNQITALIKSNRAGVLQTMQLTTPNHSTTKVSWNGGTTLPPTDLQITNFIDTDDVIWLNISPSTNNQPAFTEFNGMPRSISTMTEGGVVSVVETKQTTASGRRILLLVSAKIVQDKIALLH